MIFFDVDGTLLDDAFAVAAGLDALYARYHDSLRVARAALGPAWQRLLDEHFDRYLRGEISMQGQRRDRMRGVLRADASGAVNVLDEAFATYLAGYEKAWIAFPDTLVALPQLAGHTLGVITNGNHEQQMRKLERTGLAGFFGVVVTSEDCGATKPDRRIFLEACCRAGVAPADTIYVGDSWTSDVLGSRDAGLCPIWIDRSNADSSAASMQTLVIHSLDELPRMLNRSHPMA